MTLRASLQKLKQNIGQLQDGLLRTSSTRRMYPFLYMSCLGAVTPRPHTTLSAGEAVEENGWMNKCSVWVMKIRIFQLHFSMILLAVPVAHLKMASECLEMFLLCLLLVVSLLTKVVQGRKINKWKHLLSFAVKQQQQYS